LRRRALVYLRHERDGLWFHLADLLQRSRVFEFRGGHRLPLSAPMQDHRGLRRRDLQ
jgi:hypothetical protein